MTVEHKGHHSGQHDSCANRNLKNLWIIGFLVVAMVSFLCFALFSKREKIPSMEDMPQEVMHRSPTSCLCAARMCQLSDGYKLFSRAQLPNRLPLCLPAA